MREREWGLLCMIHPPADAIAAHFVKVSLTHIAGSSSTSTKGLLYDAVNALTL